MRSTKRSASLLVLLPSVPETEAPGTEPPSKKECNKRILVVADKSNAGLTKFVYQKEVSFLSLEGLEKSALNHQICARMKSHEMGSNLSFSRKETN